MFNTPESSRFLRYGATAFIVLAVFLAVSAIYTLRLTANVGRETPAMNTIAVNGMGEVLAVPDIATFTFGAQATGETVASAQKVVTDKIDAAIKLIKAAGTDEKDIKTVNYSINPHYEYTQTICTPYNCPPGRQNLTGYDVNQMVEVKVRDTSKAGSILGQLGSVQVTDISGLTFTVDDQEKLQAEARSKAIGDAKAKAKELSDELGVRLGRVVSFNENGSYPIPYYKTEFGMGGAADASAPAPQIPTGENKITSNVSVVYEIR